MIYLLVLQFPDLERDSAGSIFTSAIDSPDGQGGELEVSRGDSFPSNE